MCDPHASSVADLIVYKGEDREVFELRETKSSGKRITSS